MNTGAPKDNANPVILTVERTASTKGHALQLEGTPEDLAIAQVLREKSFNTKSLLLDRAGVELQTVPYEAFSTRKRSLPVAPSSSGPEPVSIEEIYAMIRNIQDPEHPLTLEQLGVVSRSQISLNRKKIQVRFTPTVPHCSMATHIGLCLRTKLTRSLPQYQVRVEIEPGSHSSERAINKQLADKERVCAALENKHLLAVVNRCIRNGMTGNMS